MDTQKEAQFEVKEGGAVHRLTIAPATKRVTIKIAEGSTSTEYERVETFFRKIFESVRWSAGFTTRGSMPIGGTSIVMESDSRIPVSEFTE